MQDRKPRRVALIGATGSIGDSTLKVIESCPESLELVAIAASKNVIKLAEIAKKFRVKHVALSDESAWKKAKESHLFENETNLLTGLESLCTLANLPEVDLVVIATVGTHGLAPTLSAIRANKTVALANKEVLVMAGKWVMEEAKARNVRILPLDSEHNALFQCLDGKPASDIKNLILTASGGPFRTFTKTQMATVKPQDALKHPNWQMGPKVTLDCATLANKGLELIEAHWLFEMPENKIEIVVHPQSIIHSMVEFIDGSVLAHLSPPKMTFAIQNSLLYPHRSKSVLEPLNFQSGLNLTFEAPDLERFPALSLARKALAQSGGYPAIFNAANEVAIEAFLEDRLSFLQIPNVIEETFNSNWEVPQSLENILEIDQRARLIAAKHILAFQS